jgi:hypothetical protein
MITNRHQDEVAKAMAGEAFVYPTHRGFSSTLTTVDVTDSALAGEYGTRISVSRSRSSNAVEFTAIKTGSIVPTSGEIIAGTALFSAATTGTLLTENLLPSVSHTDAFDIEFIETVTYRRI